MAFPVTPTTAGKIARTGWSVIGWLRDREEEQHILRASIARAICPQDTTGQAVQDLAGKVETRLWERQGSRRDAGVVDRVKEFTRSKKRRLEDEEAAWPYWRAGLTQTFREQQVVSDRELKDARVASTCPGLHGTAEDFTASIPKYLIEELADESRMTPLRCTMLERLLKADQLLAWLEARERPSQVRTTAAGVAGVVAGTGVTEAITNAPLGASVGVGVATAAASIAVSQLHERRERKRLRACLQIRLHVRRWIGDFLIHEAECPATASIEDLRAAAGRFGTATEQQAPLEGETAAALREDLRSRLLADARDHDDEDLEIALADLEDGLVRLARGSGSRAAIGGSLATILEIIEAPPADEEDEAGAPRIETEVDQKETMAAA